MELVKGIDFLVWVVTSTFYEFCLQSEYMLIEFGPLVQKLGFQAESGGLTYRKLNNTINPHKINIS